MTETQPLGRISSSLFRSLATLGLLRNPHYELDLPCRQISLVPLVHDNSLLILPRIEFLRHPT